MALEQRFNSNELWYGQRSEWTVNSPQYGTYTTSDTPAQGYFVAGSHIPGGRFIVSHPDNKSVTNPVERLAILPDKLGTSLIKDDGTDYADIIANALDGDGNFKFLGVSPVQDCKPDICNRAQINYENKKQGFNEAVIPDTLIGPQPKPIGYAWAESIDNYWNFKGQVSAINNDIVYVYCEVAMEEGDDVYVRVQVEDANAAVDQLLGGVTNTASVGTQDPAKYFKLRVVMSAAAGAAVGIQLV